MRALYMAVDLENDELPLFVGMTAQEVAEWAGTSQESVYSGIFHAAERGGRSRFARVYLGEDLVIVCNEEVKLQGLEPNVLLNGDMLVGTIIVFGNDGDSFGDIPITFGEWKEIIETAGGPFKW